MKKSWSKCTGNDGDKKLKQLGFLH